MQQEREMRDSGQLALDNPEHDWIVVGSLRERADARCCRCGIVRHYELEGAQANVSYSSYGRMLADGPLEEVDAPPCQASEDRASHFCLKLSRHWDILTAV